MQTSELLTPQTVLQRLPEIILQLTSNNQLKISMAGNTVTCSAHALVILDIFATPTSLRDAIQQLRLRVSGGQDCVDQWQTLIQLYKIGVLQEESNLKANLPIENEGFDSLFIHREMLNDRTRMDQYFAAIEKVVRPGDIVLDIGTGTGVLAMVAARAGARHVYAIEAGLIGKIARDLFAANGLSESITLISGWSTHITLPERADVMISEIIGNEPLGERVLEVTADAKRRLLKPNARMLPQKLGIYGLAVSVPDAELEKHIITSATSRNWAHWYGIDFSLLAKTATDHPAVFSVRPYKAQHWQTLSAPLLLAEIDSQADIPQVIEQNVRFAISEDGSFNGLLLYFDLALSSSNHITTNPMTAQRDCHWDNQVWLIPVDFRAKAGDEYIARYRHGITGVERIAVTRA